MEKKIKNYSRGFTLIEVLMAMTVFSLFIVVFMSTQGYNISNSVQMKKDIEMHNLAELKMQEALLEPPEFSGSKSEYIDEKTFEETKWEKYSYKIEYLKLELPNLNDLVIANQDDSSKEEDKNKELQKKILDKLKTNMEKMIWQIRVTIKDKETGSSYSLASWLSNPKAKIDLNLSL